MNNCEKGEKMLILVEATPARAVQDVPDFDVLLQGHLAFLQKCVDEGMVLFFGPKPAGGGVFLLKIGSVEETNRLLENDPFYTERVNSYTCTVFSMDGCADCVKEWFAE